MLKTGRKQKPVIVSRKAAKFEKGKIIKKMVIKNLCVLASLRENFFWFRLVLVRIYDGKLDA